MRWLKFDCSLPAKPETLAITASLGWTDPDLTVGKLMRLFSWFDEHTVDGNACGVTEPLLDHVIGVSGFAQAVASAGWLHFSAEGVSLEKFDRHNGASAKSRSETARRVAKHRANKPGNAEVTEKPLARKEKIKKNTTSIEVVKPADVPDQVWTDWLKHRKAKRATVTQTVLEGAVEQAALAGLTLEQFLRVWVRRGSQGLEAAWIKDDDRKAVGAGGESFSQRASRQRVEGLVPGVAARGGPQSVVIEEVR